MTNLTSSVDHELTVEYVPVGELREHPENPHKGDMDAIRESLATSKQYAPVIASRVSGYVLAGNHTFRGIVELGWEKVATVFLENLTSEAEKRILLSSNRINALGTDEPEAVLRLLQALEDDLAGTGYTSSDLEDLSYVLAGVEEITAPDTDAHSNETDEQRAERAERVGNWQPLSAQGLAEIILVLTTEKKQQLLDWCEWLRGQWGPLTNGEIVHAALARVVERPGETPKE